MVKNLMVFSFIFIPMSTALSHSEFERHEARDFFYKKSSLLFKSTIYDLCYEQTGPSEGKSSSFCIEIAQHFDKAKTHYINQSTIKELEKTLKNNDPRIVDAAQKQLDDEIKRNPNHNKNYLDTIKPEEIGNIIRNVHWIMQENKQIHDTNRELERIQKDLQNPKI